MWNWIKESTKNELSVPSGMTQEQMSNVKTLLQPWKEGIQKQQSQLKKTASSLRQERFELYKKKDFENDSYLVVGVIVHQGMFIFGKSDTICRQRALKYKHVKANQQIVVIIGHLLRTIKKTGGSLMIMKLQNLHGKMFKMNLSVEVYHRRIQLFINRKNISTNNVIWMNIQWMTSLILNCLISLIIMIIRKVMISMTQRRL